MEQIDCFLFSRGARSENGLDFIIFFTPSSADQTREFLNENTMSLKQRYLPNHALKLHQKSLQNTPVFPENIQLSRVTKLVVESSVKHVKKNVNFRT